MPKPTIVDLTTLFNAEIIQPLCDLAWDVFGHPVEDRPVNTVAEAQELLLDSVYPVGSIYFCSSVTDPNGVLPGTWELLTEGQFLVSAGGTGDYTLGSTGGEAEVTLTEAQMPSHQHEVDYVPQPSGTSTSNWRHPATYEAGSSNLNTRPTGGDEPHENRPPYLAVNMWQRTA